MKKILTITGILSWVNMVFGGLMTLFSIVGFMMMGVQAIPSLLMAGAIVLHSYAAIQLRRSCMDPEFPLDSKTPTGIRLVGFFALFFSFLIISSAVLLISNTAQVMVEASSSMPDEALKQVNMEGIIKGISWFFLLFDISIAVNVLLNFSLLKAYRQYHDNSNG